MAATTITKREHQAIKLADHTHERSKFEATRTHFDTNHHLTIVWDLSDAEQAGRQLTETIRATLPHLAKLTDA